MNLLAFGPGFLVTWLVVAAAGCRQGSATTTGQTLEARLSLGLLAGDDGRMNLKMKAVVLTSSGGHSGPLDSMPDIGAGATRLE
jgi:hypothetical protein